MYLDEDGAILLDTSTTFEHVSLASTPEATGRAVGRDFVSGAVDPRDESEVDAIGHPGYGVDGGLLGSCVVTSVEIQSEDAARFRSSASADAELVGLASAWLLLAVRRLESGEVVGVHRFAYTYGLLVGLNALNYRTRFCFERASDALVALAKWDGRGDPPGVWVKEKNRTMERLNPNLAGIPVVQE